MLEYISKLVRFKNPIIKMLLNNLNYFVGQSTHNRGVVY